MADDEMKYTATAEPVSMRVDSLMTANIMDVIGAAGVLLFSIKADGTITRGPAFTTVDEMSLKFWHLVEDLAKRALRN